MNDREKIIYLLGTLGDVNRSEAIDALKKFFDLEESELIEIIDEVKEFNNHLMDKYQEKNESIFLVKSGINEIQSI